jgi:hypothetical protein
MPTRQSKKTNLPDTNMNTNKRIGDMDSKLEDLQRELVNSKESFTDLSFKVAEINNKLRTTTLLFVVMNTPLSLNDSVKVREG